jgi:ABC-type sugar transport system ATPase subunit
LKSQDEDGLWERRRVTRGYAIIAAPPDDVRNDRSGQRSSRAGTPREGIADTGMSELLLQAQGITKHYGGIDALNSVDLEIRPGEVVALMGENGAGKSTMAKIIAGVEQPDSGTLHWDGAPVTFRDTRDAARAGIAIVLQELSLIPDLSVAENIFLAHQDAYRGGWWLDRRSINRATRDLARRLGWDLPLDP